MKGAIYYYSGSGNTELACKFVAAKINQAQFELFDMTRSEKPDLKPYDVLGFAFPTHHLGVEEIFAQFVAGLEMRPGQPVFMLNTYGVMPGKAAKIVNSLLEKRGARLIAFHALMLPENYPPFIAQGVTGADQPDAKQMAAFHQFILGLGDKLDQIRTGLIPEKAKVKLDIFSRLIPVKSRAGVLKEMGTLKLDAALCTQCGQCAQSCCYHAIRMEGTPVFVREQCRGCWTCFNHCPQKAIYTDKVKAAAQYPGPGSKLIEKLG